MSESHLQSRGFVLDPGQALLWVLDSCARIARISAAVCVAEVTLISSECCFAALHNLIDVDVDERLKDRSICEYRWGYEEQQVSWCCLVLCYFTERRMRELDMFKPTSSLTSHWRGVDINHSCSSWLLYCCKFWHLRENSFSNLHICACPAISACFCFCSARFFDAFSIINFKVAGTI